MDEHLQEYCDGRGTRLRVDRAAGVIHGVKVLGLRSRNGREYLPEALARAIPLYEDAKVNVNHPKGDPAAPRDYQDRLGAIRNVALRPGAGLFADFHFNPCHALAEQLLWDAEHAPENVGFSHNVLARTTRRGAVVVVEAITRVQGVDLVADPATTRGLFEDGQPAATQAAAAPVEAAPAAAVAGLETVTLAELRQHRPELVAELDAEHATECAVLRAEIERLARQQAADARRQLACRLLREHRLPDPDDDTPAGRAICGPQFFAALLAAEDETALRAMVEERAALVRALGGRNAAPAAAQPAAREQLCPPAADPRDAAAFVRAIT
jgi:hypothetical protein